MTVRALILTSTFRRHQFLVHRLGERVDVVGVWQEEKSFVPLRYAESDQDERVIAAHFAARDESESAWFAADEALRVAPHAVAFRVPPGGCNAPEAVDAMQALAPEVVLVFGTGILKRGLIDAFPGRIINLHLGLSPYYRGAGTNFWPLVNGEPEYVGATIHYLDEGIDTGAILAHVRPQVLPHDGPHDLGNRTIVAAADRLADAAHAHMGGRVRPVAQARDGRFYQRKDFSAAAVQQLYRNFEAGMIRDYLDSKADRDARLRLVDLPLPAKLSERRNGE